MPKTRGTGLLMAWTDVDPAHEDEFNRWYETEYIGRLSAVPGFLSGARYRALRGGPKYLAMYELEDHTVLRSAAFADAVRSQPPGRRMAVSPDTAVRNFLMNGYRQIFPARTHPAENLSEQPRYGAHQYHGLDGRRIQRLVQYLLYPGISESPWCDPGATVRGSRRGTEISDSL
jgi:hypothetical protein